MKTGTIYGLKIRGTDRILYVGQTTRDPAERLESHWKHVAASGAQTPICSWLRESGREAVELVVLESEIPADCLLACEERWIFASRTLTSEGGLNVRLGYGWRDGRGAARPPLDRQTDDERRTIWRQRLSAAAKKRAAERPDELSARWRRRYEDPEQRRLAAERSTQMWQDPAARNKLTASARRRAQTDEGRAAMSRAGKAGGSRGASTANHNRWHVARKKKSATCPLCQAEGL